MSGRQLARVALLFVALVLLWGAAAVWRRHSSSGPTGDAFRLPRVDRAKLDEVLLTRTQDTIRLARKDSSWTVNGRAANQAAVGDLLTALSDTSVTGDLVAERRGSQAGLGTDSASATRLQAKAGGRTVADLMIGRTSPDLSGGYVRPADREPTWQVQSRLVELATKPVDEWRDRRIVSIKPDQVGSVELSRGRRRLTVARSGSAGWSLSPGGTADSSRVNDLLAAWRDVQATGFASPAQADSARFSPPDGRARVLGKDGKPLVTLLFDSTATAWWVKSDTGSTVYRMESFGVDRLMPADSALKPARPAPKG